MKKSPTISVCAAFAGAIALLPVQALGEEAPDAPIVVTARLDDPASATASAMSLSQRDIAAQAPVSLLDSLVLLPGIDAFEKGGPGGGSYLALRGGEPNFTLVAINGVRVNDPMVSSGGGFDFSLIGAGDVSRVDVLSGPWSTAYGADALSGVISVRLDDPGEQTGAAARIGLGSGGRFELGARGHIAGKAGSLTFAASARDTARPAQWFDQRGPVGDAFCVARISARSSRSACSASMRAVKEAAFLRTAAARSLP